MGLASDEVSPTLSVREPSGDGRVIQGCANDC